MTVKEGKYFESLFVIALFIFAYVFFFGFNTAFAAPVGPSDLQISNESAAINSSYLFNVSGGQIATINFTVNTQNTRWKGAVGQVTGSFTLDDASGSTLYDWNITAISGEVYATRASGSISWNTISCANAGQIETENVAIGHTGRYDNITSTFNNQTHDGFQTAGSAAISADSCFAAHTYIGGISTNSFDEVVLRDGSNIIFAALLETNVVGFDGATYDFQMVMPENGTSNTIPIPYYMYIELTS